MTRDEAEQQAWDEAPLHFVGLYSGGCDPAEVEAFVDQRTDEILAAAEKREEAARRRGQ